MTNIHYHDETVVCGRHKSEESVITLYAQWVCHLQGHLWFPVWCGKKENQCNEKALHGMWDRGSDTQKHQAFSI